MHWENLAPLLVFWPIFAALGVLLVAWAIMEWVHRLRRARNADDEAHRYWASEMAYRAKLFARERLGLTRTPRLQYQPAMSDTEIAARLASEYSEAMDDPFTLRLARAKFRAWHRGTREADFTIGGFFDRYHADWGEDELAWFEALLEEDEVDVLAWAMATADAPERFQGPLLQSLQKLDYVSI